MERFGETWKGKRQDESDTGDKNKVKVLVKNWLVFSAKNLNKMADLNQKIWKNKRMKGKLGNDSINSSLYKINKSKLSKVRQSKPCNNSRLRCWLCCCKDSKVVYFKWSVLDFASEIVLNLFLLFKRKFCSTSLAKYTEAVVQRYSVKKVFLEILQNSNESTCARVSFFNEAAGQRPPTLFKKRLWHRCFPVNFTKFLRTPFVTEHFWRLLLNTVNSFSGYY